MAAVVERVLAGLDEDLLEYVIGLCEDTDDDGDLAEAVAAFCLSSELCEDCLLYTSPSPRDATLSRMPSSA